MTTLQSIHLSLYALSRGMSIRISHSLSRGAARAGCAGCLDARTCWSACSMHYVPFSAQAVSEQADGELGHFHQVQHAVCQVQPSTTLVQRSAKARLIPAGSWTSSKTASRPPAFPVFSAYPS